MPPDAPAARYGANSGRCGPFRNRLWRASTAVVPTGGVFRRRAGRVNPVGGSPIGGGEAGLLAQLERYVDARARYDAGDMPAEKLPIVIACRTLIADTVAQCPQYAYGPDGQMRSPQPVILARPDPAELRFVTMSRLVNNLTGRHGYVWLKPTAAYADGYPAAVQVIDAPDAAGVFDPTGRRLTDVYYCGERYDPGPDGIMWLPNHVPDTPGKLGCSPLSDCERAIAFFAALYQMAGSYWEAGFPSVAYIVEQSLNKASRDEVKAELTAAWRRSHTPTVVDRGGRFEALGSSAVEAQLVESIETANTEVARAYGVMPSLVNVRAGDSLTYATSAAELAKWIKLGLGGYLARVDAAFGEFTPHGTVVRSDVTALLRGDVEQRIAFYDAGLRGGWLDADADVRPAEGLPPRPGTTPPRRRPASLLADPIGANQ